LEALNINQNIRLESQYKLKF